METTQTHTYTVVVVVVYTVVVVVAGVGVAIEGAVVVIEEPARRNCRLILLVYIHIYYMQCSFFVPNKFHAAYKTCMDPYRRALFYVAACGYMYFMWAH